MIGCIGEIGTKVTLNQTNKTQDQKNKKQKTKARDE